MEKDEEDNNIKYEVFKYSFKNANETIRAAIRLFNSMNMNDETLEQLMVEFHKINPDNTPPRLGKKVNIPVLSEYAHKHKS